MSAEQEQHQSIMQLSKQNASLQAEVNEMNRKYARLQQIHSETKNSDITEQQIQQYLKDMFPHIALKYPILAHLIGQSYSNIFKEPHARRYDHLHEFLTLLSLNGKNIINILHETLMLPTLRTVHNYKKSMYKELNIDENIFDGSFENIQRLVNFGGFQIPSKATLMIDACYIEPYASIDSEGNIIGMIDLPKIDEDSKIECIETEEAFLDFLSNFKEHIIHAEFVFMLCSTDGAVPPIPIYCKPATSGTANEKIHDDIQQIVEHLQNIGIFIQGIGTDGDKQYAKYNILVRDHIAQNISEFLTEDFVKFVDEHEIKFHFSDPYHLLKRDRYRKIEASEYHSFPDTNSKTYDSTIYINEGFPNYIIDNTQARKMEDSLALRFFDPNLVDLLNKDDTLDILITFLPSTLMSHSIFTKLIPRAERIDRLMLGASIVFIYLFWEEYTEHQLRVSKEAKLRSYKNNSPFTVEWCREYISTALGIVYCLATEQTLYLGAFGTHPLEHLFGNIRRICSGKDTHQDFMKAAQTILLERYLRNYCGLDGIKTYSRKDSGEIVEGDIFNEPICFGTYFDKAVRLINSVRMVPKQLHVIGPYVHVRKSSKEIVKKILPKICERSPKFISTKKKGIIKTGGMKVLRRWKAGSQMKDVVGTDKEIYDEEYDD